MWANVPRGSTNGMFQASAHCAAIRRVRFSPPPPTQMGSSACTGLGTHLRLVQLEVRALEVDVTSSRSRPRTHWIALLELSMRTLRPTGTGCRRRRYSISLQPAPRPRSARPPDSWSMVQMALASTAGMAVPDRVDERAAADTRRVAGQRGVGGHRLQALGVVAGLAE